MSIKEIIISLKNWSIYILNYWLHIVIVGVIGASCGFYYAFQQPVNYSAKTTFIIEEGKSMGASLGNLSSIAGQFGLDLGNSTAGNVLAGENIIQYFKSPALSREVLLSEVGNGGKETIADFYCTVYNLKEKWRENNISEIRFFDYYKYSNKRLYDSLLQRIASNILDKNFLITKTEKKSGFFDVIVTTKNENLSKLYCERIVQLVIKRYINTKTQRQLNTINLLQKRADSIRLLLNNKVASNAQLQSNNSTMDINPLYKTKPSIDFETLSRDKTILGGLYASVIQNLEVAKFSLSQESPVIQIIDSPIFPLQKIKISKLKNSVLFFIYFSFIYIVILIFKRFFKKIGI